jgi:hypothetical protein
MSEVKVNKISPRSGTTVTLGDSGDTFTIPAGASITNSGTASGFGATGSASWNTTVKTGDFTAVAGEGYFVNTTSGEIDVTLPASPSAGAVVAVKDYAGTWDTNSCILLRNGSNIGGQALDSTLSTEGLAVTLVYIDATKGWLVTDSGLQSEAPGPEFISATGGTITTVCTNFKVHTFTGPGTFTVNSAGNSAGSNTVSYVVVAGGGAGGGAPSGNDSGGGGGAGGYREGLGLNDSFTGSPLRAPTGVPVTATAFPITVGAGGGQGPAGGSGLQGNNSVFSTITSTGGGGGGGFVSAPAIPGGPGGSGGAGAGGNPGGACASPGGTGNTPPVSPPQGNNGARGSSPGDGDSKNYWGGGGGGATVAGAVGPASNGGAGATSSINATPTARSGGGGGGPAPSRPSPVQGGGTGGAGGGGAGAGGTGGVNTGGGGGGGSNNLYGGVGGSGIVIIRYKFQ